MTDEEFRQALLNAFCAGPPFETYELLVRYRDSGGQQAKAYEILLGIINEVREAGVNEDVEDAIVDVGDAIVGDIARTHRIWPDRLEF